MEAFYSLPSSRVPWNKGKLTGQKPSLKLSEIWAIRTRLSRLPWRLTAEQC